MDLKLQALGLDETIQKFSEMPGVFQQARKSAIKSVGYEVQQEFKRFGDMARNEWGGAWPRLNPYSARIKSGKKRQLNPRPRYKKGPRKGQIRLTTRTFSGQPGGLNPMGRLVNAPRYKVNKQGTAVQIGFYGTPASIIEQHEDPQRIRITPKMRRFFWAIGLPLAKNTSQLKVPARPFFSPVRNKMVPKLGEIYEGKFINALGRRGVHLE